MEKEKLLKIQEDNLPLFLIVDNENYCYVIDNYVVGNVAGGSANHYPFNAFYNLQRLFDSIKLRKVIPHRLHQYFTNVSNLPKGYAASQLVGHIHDHCVRCVFLDMDINESNSQPVELTNIVYKDRFREFPFKPINLTSYEAFLIFANILANDRLFFYEGLFEQNIISSFEYLTDELKPKIIHKYHYETFGDAYIKLVDFNHEYLFYIKEELLSKRITPYELAFYGAIRTLCFLTHLKPVQDFTYQLLEEIKSPLKLPINYQIVSYCYLNALISYSHFGHELKLFKNEDLHNLRKITQKDFPQYVTDFKKS
ncbi:MAG: hypothetical protein FK730_14585 [Asgard group archaeon]|nr:hypothetical protein [Asgard group archaeon]